MGGADRRADRAHRHPLEQGLDHREQRHQRLEMLRASPWARTGRPATTCWINDPRKDGATHYNEVIVRALEAGWSREKIGSHIVRNNTHLQLRADRNLREPGRRLQPDHEATTSTTSGPKRQFAGAEMAGIKTSRRHRRADQGQPDPQRGAGTVDGLDGAGHADHPQPLLRQHHRRPLRRGEPRAVSGGQQPLPLPPAACATCPRAAPTCTI